MRILMVSHEYPPIGGGGANACMNLAHKYVEKGNEVILCTPDTKSSISEFRKIPNKNFSIVNIPTRRKNNEHCTFKDMLEFVIKATWSCSKLLDEKEIDVCQVFFGIPSGPIGVYLRRKYRVPYIIRLGGGDIPGFQNRYKFLYKILGIPIKYIWKHAGFIVANSEGLRKNALLFSNKSLVEVIPNGVDTDFFSPINEHNTLQICAYNKEISKIKNGDYIHMLCVARLIERKGLQDIIPYLDRMALEIGKDIIFSIVGDGPYREHLERLAKNINDTKIVFWGQLSKDELVSIYQSSDVFVFPSYKEGMPNAVLEAMASGLPIFMRANCESAKELVHDNGVLSQGNIVEDLISMLKKDKIELRKMGNRSRERAISEFSWNSSAEQYLDMMEQLVVKKQLTE